MSRLRPLFQTAVLGFVAVCALCSAAPRADAHKASPMRVVFLSPTNRTNHPFWNNFETFMSDAADNLGIELRILHSKDRYGMLDQAGDVLGSKDKPDYLVFFFYRRVGVQILDLAQRAGVGAFTVNSNIHPDCFLATGLPRQKYPLWLGHMYPDDFKAGYGLARDLLAEARRLGLRAPDGKIHVLALSGDLSNDVALERDIGLRQAVFEAGDVVIDRLVHADWSATEAYEKADYLIHRYPEAGVIWAASDVMAGSAAKACRVHGRRPGGDVVIGGIDWAAPGLAGVANGTLQVSYGGHFMEGAWSLVLLYDHFQGRDFKDVNTVFRTPYFPLTACDLPDDVEILDHDAWKRIDFTRFLRPAHPKNYDFSPGAVISVPRIKDSSRESESAQRHSIPRSDSMPSK